MTDDRAAWHEWRRQGLGASDIPALLGISRYASPFSVWAEKVDLLPPDDTDSDYADFGRYAERMVAPWFTAKTGLHIAGEQTWCTHWADDLAWARCTVDGFVFESPTTADPAAALGVEETKTRNPGRRYDELPDDMQAQGQWQMLVTGLPQVWFFVLHGRRPEIYELPADEGDQAFILARAREFWTGHVLTGEPPPIDGHEATLDALAAIYPTASPKSSIPIDDVAGALVQLREAKRWEKAAKGVADAASAVVRFAMGGNFEGTVDGVRAVTLGVSKRTHTCSECGHVDEGEPFRQLLRKGVWA